MAKRAKVAVRKKATIATDPFIKGPDAPVKKIGTPFTSANAAVISKTEPDKKGAANPRQSVLTAFGLLGGTRWLVKYAKRDPKGFAGLLAKAMPQDVNLTGTVGYAPLVIPVEQREAIPGEFTEIPLVPRITPETLEELDPFT